METISVGEARRLALARGGLLAPRWTDLPARAQGRGLRARKAARRVIRRFGYLQLDSVSIAGARSHALVLLSRLEGFDPTLAEALLEPGAPYFEYWGHEASWLPIELYPLFGFRREGYRVHPWWGPLLDKHRDLAEQLVRRLEDEGPLRSIDLEPQTGGGWWQLSTAKKVMNALWSSGRVAIRSRRGFQRTYDLRERVIPEHWRNQVVPVHEALQQLLLRALAGHGWATVGTLASTWRLRNLRPEIQRALDALTDTGSVVPCTLVESRQARTRGFVRPRDLELASRLRRLRPRTDRGVLLSPFDPVLWERARVARLFGFDQLLEIFKPAAQRRWGYYCLPVLAGETLVGRVDLKAERKLGRLRVLSRHREDGVSRTLAEHATDQALDRLATALALALVPG